MKILILFFLSLNFLNVYANEFFNISQSNQTQQFIELNSINSNNINSNENIQKNITNCYYSCGCWNGLFVFPHKRLGNQKYK